jgi:uncharacterized Ntn-hydrolase superfamily protein
MYQAGFLTLKRGLVFLMAVMALIPISSQSARSDESVGTFSIVAVDTLTGEVGVAVQSRVFGVGQRVAWVNARAGAIATQAQSNETFGPIGLRLMENGLSAEETLDWLLAHDDGRDSRQVGVVDLSGGVANWTGPTCLDWAGDSAGVAFTCQGNILVSGETVAAMTEAFRETADSDLAVRLIAALEAGQAAGGDSRGQQSAAVLVGRYHPDFPEYTTRYVDIRTDDHETPIAELRRLYEMYEAQGLVQAHMRFSEYYGSQGDSLAVKREIGRVGGSLSRILSRGCDDAGMLNSLAWFTAINDVFLPEALSAAKLAVSLEPGNSNILDTLAEVHFRIGNRKEAIAVMEKALSLSPDDNYLKGQLARFKGETP